MRFRPGHGSWLPRVLWSRSCLVGAAIDRDCGSVLMRSSASWGGRTLATGTRWDAWVTFDLPGTDERMGERPTPLGAIGRGLFAGAVGTAAMTAWQALASKLREAGGSPTGSAGSGEGQEDPWEDASAPAKVAKRGACVWASSYAQLVPMGLYEPPWKYPPQTLALDLS